MKYTLKDVSIEAKSKKEKEYCEKNNIELRRLKNGITIVGIACQMDNASWADVEFSFSTGAYDNPAGQVHFLEHFFNKKINKLAEKNDVEINAFTSQLGVSQTSKGVCNPNVDNFGIWEILPLIRKGLENPIYETSAIESEKKVIADEIVRRRNDHDFLAGKHFRKVVYGTKNPLFETPLITGDLEDLGKINLDSLNKIVEKVLVPDGMVIKVYTEGEKRTAKILVDKMEDLFSDFPRKENKSNKVDPKLRDELNPDFKPGEVYIKDTEIKNNRITFGFVWVFKVPFPEIERFALTRIISPLYANLHEYSRIAGWGYYTNVYTDRPSYNLSILSLRIDTNKMENPEKFAKEELLPAIKKHVIGTVNEKIIQEICDLEDKKQRAIAVRNHDRLDWVVDGLSDFGKIIDGDILKKIYLDIKPKHIQDFISTISKIEPAVIITGDLS